MPEQKPLQAGHRPPVVDLEHLNRYTGGDVAVNAEVLRLFQGQAAEMLSRMEHCLITADQAQWFSSAHTFKGAARGIGAFPLAEAIAAAERLDLASRIEEARGALILLKARNGQVMAFIASYLA